MPEDTTVSEQTTSEQTATPSAEATPKATETPEATLATPAATPPAEETEKDIGHFWKEALAGKLVVTPEESGKKPEDKPEDKPEETPPEADESKPESKAGAKTEEEIKAEKAAQEEAKPEEKTALELATEAAGAIKPEDSKPAEPTAEEAQAKILEDAKQAAQEEAKTEFEKKIADLQAENMKLKGEKNPTIQDQIEALEDKELQAKLKDVAENYPEMAAFIEFALSGTKQDNSPMEDRLAKIEAENVQFKAEREAEREEQRQGDEYMRQILAGFKAKDGRDIPAHPDAQAIVNTPEFAKYVTDNKLESLNTSENPEHGAMLLSAYKENLVKAVAKVEKDKLVEEQKKLDELNSTTVRTRNEPGSPKEEQEQGEAVFSESFKEAVAAEEKKRNVA